MASLISVFNKKKEKTTDKERIKDIENTLSKSKLGKDLLGHIKDNNFSIIFAKGMNCIGFCNSSEKKLYLNPAFTDNTLVFTLAHEARHAIQEQKNINLTSSETSPETTLAITKIKEADADTFAGLTAWQLKDQNPKVWDSFKFHRKKMALSIEKSFKNNEETNTVMTNVFKSWFNDKLVDSSYEKQTCDFISRASKALGNDTDNFIKQIPLSEIIGNICLNNSKSYFVGSLKKSDFFSMRPENLERLEKIFDNRKEKYGIKKPKGLSVIRKASKESTGAFVMAKSKQLSR